MSYFYPQLTLRYQSLFKKIKKKKIERLVGSLVKNVVYNIIVFKTITKGGHFGFQDKKVNHLFVTILFAKICFQFLK